jgi:thiol-disulfide isomerase/thioredoxin
VTALETTLVVGLGVWMLLLTVTVLVVVRQIAVVMLRLDRDGSGSAPVDDGIDVGSAVPGAVAGVLDTVGDRPSFVLVLAAVCGPCRELAPQLRAVEPTTPLTVLVVGGDERLAGELVALIPTDTRTVTGAAARDAAAALEISTTPFVFEVRDERIAAKAAVRGFDHLAQYINEAESVMTSELWAAGEVTR